MEAVVYTSNAIQDADVIIEDDGEQITAQSPVRLKPTKKSVLVTRSKHTGIKHKLKTMGKYFEILTHILNIKQRQR